MDFMPIRYRFYDVAYTKMVEVDDKHAVTQVVKWAKFLAETDDDARSIVYGRWPEEATHFVLARSKMTHVQSGARYGLDGASLSETLARMSGNGVEPDDDAPDAPERDDAPRTPLSLPARMAKCNGQAAVA